MAATIRDVAGRANVSLATVSRYYSGSKIVSDELARKIETAAKELDYKHKGHKKRNRGVIAVLMPQLKYEFFHDVLNELMRQVVMYDYRMVLIPMLEDNDDYKILFKELPIDGVIYLDEEINRDVFNYISSKRIKTVMCGGTSFDSRSMMVHINDMAAAYEGARYLIELGHEKILFLSDYPKSISSGYQRLMGCKRALEEYNIPFQEDENVLYGSVTYTMGYRLMKQYLDSKKECTAVFAFSDEMAMGVISALHAEGLKVPEDISVLGFDDITVSKRVVPPLTTIHQPIKEMVKQTLDSFLNRNTDNINMEITLPFELKRRETCKVIKLVK